MTTQVVFNIDKVLKDQAMKKAKREGLPFASVLKIATRAYVKGAFDVEFVGNEKFNAKTAKSLTRALNDIKNGKNLSGPFRSGKELDTFLDSIRK